MSRAGPRIARSIAVALVLAVASGLPPIGIAARAQTAEPPAAAASPIASHVAEAAQRFGIPEGWIYAVMRVESANDPAALSPKGAMGLMQVMPGTYADLRARYGLGPDPYAPRDNILAGAAYLREMYDRFGSPGFLAAYNAGPGRYLQYLDGRALPSETRTYVALLSPRIGAAHMPAAAAPPDPLAWTRAALFVQLAGPADADFAPVDPTSAAPSADHRVVAGTPARPAPADLFVVLSGDRR